MGVNWAARTGSGATSTKFHGRYGASLKRQRRFERYWTSRRTRHCSSIFVEWALSIKQAVVLARPICLPMTDDFQPPLCPSRALRMVSDFIGATTKEK